MLTGRASHLETRSTSRALPGMILTRSQRRRTSGYDRLWRLRNGLAVEVADLGATPSSGNLRYNHRLATNESQRVRVKPCKATINSRRVLKRKSGSSRGTEKKSLAFHSVRKGWWVQTARLHWRSRQRTRRSMVWTPIKRVARASIIRKTPSSSRSIWSTLHPSSLRWIREVRLDCAVTLITAWSRLFSKRPRTSRSGNPITVSILMLRWLSQCSRSYSLRLISRRRRGSVLRRSSQRLLEVMDPLMKLLMVTLTGRCQLCLTIKIWAALANHPEARVPSVDTILLLTEKV